MAYPPPPYADAVTGTPLTGEAITGAWWAYSTSAGLKLGGYPPEVITLQGDVVPAAGLKLGTFAPTLHIDATVTGIPVAGLRLGAYLPALQLSTLLTPAAAGLLLGAYVPDSVGARWLLPVDCIPIALAPDPESELVLVAAGSVDVSLEPLECL